MLQLLRLVSLEQPLYMSTDLLDTDKNWALLNGEAELRGLVTSARPNVTGKTERLDQLLVYMNVW